MTETLVELSIEECELVSGGDDGTGFLGAGTEKDGGGAMGTGT